MAINFPSSPQQGDTHVVGNTTYIFDGTKWTASVIGGFGFNRIIQGNTTADVIDTGSDGRFIVATDGLERLRVDSVGQVDFSHSGTAASPTLVFNGDTNTGIYSPGGNQLALSTNGTGRLLIDSSGRLLVGTSSSPSSDQGSASRFVVQGYVGSDEGAGIISLQRGVAATSITLGAPLGRVSFNESSGNAFGWIQCVADGTAGSGDYPGRIEFSTNSGSPDPYPIERMRIHSNGNVSIGYSGYNINVGLRLGTPLTGATSSYGVYHQGQIQPDTTVAARYFMTAASTAANGGTPYTIGSLRHFEAAQSSFNADSTVSNQYGFFVAPTFVGATNNYGFYSGIPVASGRWNFYAAGSAPNYFAGGVRLGGTATANELDDYEEGTFTPTVIGSTTAGTHTYPVRNGKYTKIGNKVFFEIYVNWANGTGVGSLRVGGLPFTVTNTDYTFPAVAIGYADNIALSANHQLLALCSSNNTYIYFYQIPSGGGSNVDVPYDTNGVIILSGHYAVS